MKAGLRKYLEVGGTLVLLSLSGQFEIPVPGIDVPITLQSMVVILLPLIFNWKNTTAGVALFLVFAAAGAPILAGGTGGIERIAGKSFGFLSAFLMVNFLSGIFNQWIRKPRVIYIFLIFLLQHAIIMAAGLGWIAFTSIDPVTWGDYVAPFLPGLLAKSLLGTILVEVYFRAVLKEGI